MFKFLRHFHILGYDFDVQFGVMHAILHSVIARHAPEDAAGTWAQRLQEVAFANQNAGTITASHFPQDLRKQFVPRAAEGMPAAIVSALPPSEPRDWRVEQFLPGTLVVANLLGGWSERAPPQILHSSHN